jgi:hypothetical protein
LKTGCRVAARPRPCSAAPRAAAQLDLDRVARLELAVELVESGCFSVTTHIAGWIEVVDRPMTAMTSVVSNGA